MSQDALDLLLSGVKDQGQRKQITSAYYAFAAGDPETFAVQFAVLLRAHATSLKLLPARMEKVIATETNRMSDLILAHQVSVRPRKEAVSANGAGDSLETLKKIQSEIQRELAAHCELLKTEREKMTSAATANERVLKRLAAHRILLALSISYAAGALTVLALQRLLPAMLSYFFTASGPGL
jgi:hypothetical protein